MNWIGDYNYESDGIELPNDFIELLKTKNNQGVILAEVRATSDKPLVLEIENAEGHVVLTTELPLKLVEVEDMYAQVNIRGVVVDDGETPNQPEQDATFLRKRQANIIKDKTVPKSFNPNKHLVFLHQTLIRAK